MPVFEIGLDDGRKLHIDAVDQDAAMAGVQHFLGGQSEAPASKGGVLDAAKAGASNLLSGVGETGKRYLGVGQALKDAGAAIAPQSAPDTTLYDNNGFHAGNIPNAVAESSPSVAAALAAARLTPGPIWAKLGAAGLVGLGSSMGNFAKEATGKRTGNPEDPSSPEDLKAGAMRAAPEAAIQALPISRFLPAPVARLGAKGVMGAVGRTAVDAGAMGAGNAGANVYDQALQNGSVDPNQVIDAAAKGAVTGGAFGGARLAQDAKAAVKYRALADADPAHIAEASARIRNANENLDGNLANTGDGFTATKSAITDVGKEFGDAVGNIKSGTLTPEAESALNRAQKGLPLGDADIAALNASANPSHVSDLQRLGGVARVLQGVQKTGDFNEATGQFTGGISSSMGKHVRALANPVGAGVSAALASSGGAHLGDAFAHSPEALAALTGAYGLARFTDWASGNRSPANAFVKHFDDPSTIVPPAPGTGLQSLNAQAAQAMSPTGPKIAPAPTPWGTQMPQAPQPPAPAMSPTGPKIAPPPTPWGAPQAPQAPQQPQLPQFNPLALKALKKTMAATTAELNQPPAAQPDASTPQFNPIAMKMLKQQMANPPQAQEPSPPEAPQMPQFNPLALKMLKQQMANPPAPVLPLKGASDMLDVPPFLPNRNAPPVAPQMPPVEQQPTPQSLVPAISKLTKSNGTVKVEPKPVSKAAPPAADDLSIPTFLRRTPAPEGAPAAPQAPQVQKATTAMAKLAAGPQIDLKPDHPHAPEELSMAPKDFAKNMVATNYSPEDQARMGKDIVDKTQATIERRAAWKADVADKLAKLFPEVGDKASFYHKLMGTHAEQPVRNLRDALAAKFPERAAAVKALLPNGVRDSAAKVWHRVSEKN